MSTLLIHKGSLYFFYLDLYSFPVISAGLTVEVYQSNEGTASKWRFWRRFSWPEASS